MFTFPHHHPWYEPAIIICLPSSHPTNFNFPSSSSNALLQVSNPASSRCQPPAAQPLQPGRDPTTPRTHAAMSIQKLMHGRLPLGCILHSYRTTSTTTATDLISQVRYFKIQDFPSLLLTIKTCARTSCVVNHPPPTIFSQNLEFKESHLSGPLFLLGIRKPSIIANFSTQLSELQTSNSTSHRHTATMKRNIVIFLIILILFFLIALIAYLIYYLQTRMAVGGTASSVSDMTESRV